MTQPTEDRPERYTEAQGEVLRWVFKRWTLLMLVVGGLVGAGIDQFIRSHW